MERRPRRAARRRWRALWVSAGALAATLALIALIFMITVVQPRPRRGAGLGAAHLRGDAPDPHDRRHHRPLRGGARPLRARRAADAPAPLIITNGATPASRSASCSGMVARRSGAGARASRELQRALRAARRRAGARRHRRRSAAQGHGRPQPALRRPAPRRPCPRLRAKLEEIAARRARQSRPPDGGDAGPRRPRRRLYRLARLARAS